MVNVDITEGIATITLDRPDTLNALTSEDYNALASALRQIDQRQDVLVTIWQARGRFFCAGTNVTTSAAAIPHSATETNRVAARDVFPRAVFPTNTDVSNAFYTHSKILVAAVNGPVLGIAAAFLGHFDFVFALPSVYLSVPFVFLGLISEAGSSVAFVNRMGLSRANEVLLLRKTLYADDLLQCGFVNKIFPAQSPEDFHATVRAHMKDELDGLDPFALLSIKRLIRTGLYEKNNPDAVNMRESYEQAERIASGVPARQFMRLANKEIKNRL